MDQRISSRKKMICDEKLVHVDFWLCFSFSFSSFRCELATFQKVLSQFFASQLLLSANSVLLVFSSVSSLQLHSLNKLISVAVHAKTDDTGLFCFFSQLSFLFVIVLDLPFLVHLNSCIVFFLESGLWQGPQAQNWQQLGAIVDRFRIMTYDWCWRNGCADMTPPGSHFFLSVFCSSSRSSWLAFCLTVV